MSLGFHVLSFYIFFCIFKLSDMQSSAYAFFLAALIHKPSNLKRFGINEKDRGSMRTALSHISCILKGLGISLIQRETFP